MSADLPVTDGMYVGRATHHRWPQYGKSEVEGSTNNNVITVTILFVDRSLKGGQT
jgi:hypothetical protein